MARPWMGAIVGATGWLALACPATLGADQGPDQAEAAIGDQACAETDLEPQPRSFCALLEVLAPYRDAPGERALQLTVGGGDRPNRLREGDDLTIDVVVPTGVRYLYLGYLQQDGTVGYLAMMPVGEAAAADGRVSLDTGYEIGPPFGQEMIVAVASERPLFTEARPAYEPIEDYRAALGERLAALHRAGPEQVLVTSGLIITTEPRAP